MKWFKKHFKELIPFATAVIKLITALIKNQ